MLAFQQSLPMLLYRALDAVMPSFRRVFTQFGVTEQQWRVLRALWECDGAGLSELAAITLIPAPSLVGVIDRLSRDGLVERRRSQTDRRLVHIHITADGRTLEARVRPVIDAVYADLCSSLDPALWEQVVENLQQVASQLNNGDYVSSSSDVSGRLETPPARPLSRQ